MPNNSVRIVENCTTLRIVAVVKEFGAVCHFLLLVARQVVKRSDRTVHRQQEAIMTCTHSRIAGGSRERGEEHCL
jgi:hypothetical protein